MHFLARASTHSCTAAVAVLATMVLSTLPCAAESLRVEGGQIADVAPDASGVRAFRGIPYAAPPVGELRWKAPHPIQAWDGVRTAAEWGPRCVQSNRLGDIDRYACLRATGHDMKRGPGALATEVPERHVDGRERQAHGLRPPRWHGCGRRDPSRSPPPSPDRAPAAMAPCCHAEAPEQRSRRFRSYSCIRCHPLRRPSRCGPSGSPAW